MSHFVYVLHSNSKGKYYVGESEDPEVRVREHNMHHFEKASTRIASDWQLKLVIPCSDRIIARKIEKHIKAMKSTKYKENLIQYPDMVARLTLKYER